MQNEVVVSESQMFVIAQLSNVAARVTGAELKKVALGTGEGDEGEDGNVRNFPIGEVCVTKSGVEITLRGEVCLSRGKGKRWDAGFITGSIYANPDHPVRFKVEKGLVKAE